MPTTRVATGAALIPKPDPNPMDCNGHGTHVSGTATGTGVNADGTAYAGPYNGSVDTAAMGIGPGVAPGAELYGLRVFGCAGSTNLTAAAINWATDPNRDGDPSDHVDVINMSLGSAYGTPDDPSAAASNNAAALGRDRRHLRRQQRRLVLRQRQPRQRGPRALHGLVAGRRRAGRRDHRQRPRRDRRQVHRLEVAELQLDRSEPGADGQRLLPGHEPVRLLGVDGSGRWRTSPAGSSSSTGRSATIRSRAARPSAPTTRPTAGATGIIMADSTTFLDTAIGGNATTPGMYTNVIVGNTLKSQLTAGVVNPALNVTLSGIVRSASRSTTRGSTRSRRSPRAARRAREHRAEAGHRRSGPDDLVAGPADGLPRP